jgi:hypothetical protein
MKQKVETASLDPEFDDDEVRRYMPGKRELTSVKEHENTVHNKNRLCNLCGSYSLFKQQHPHVKAAFSKFDEVRPRCVVTDGACGTHSACVCKIIVNRKQS